MKADKYTDMTIRTAWTPERQEGHGVFFVFFSPSLLQLLLIHSTITQSVLREEKRFSGQIDSVLAFNYNKRKKTEHLLMEQVSTKCSHLIVHAVLLMCFSVLFLYFFSCLSVSLSVYGYACWEINPQPFFFIFLPARHSSSMTLTRLK